MRSLRRVLIGVCAILAVFAGAGRAGAQSAAFVIVVNPANPITELRSDKVSKFFLKKLKAWDDGSPVLPIDLTEGSSMRDAFSTAVHHRATSAVVSFWQQQIFSGRDLPPAQKAESDALAMVRNNPGAIAYVSQSADVHGVKIVPLR